MTRTIYTIEEIKNIISPIAQKYPITKIYLFGSYARGEATEKSDVDFSLEYREDAYVSLITLADIIADFEEALGKHVDCISEDSVSLKFLFGIADEKVLLYEIF